MAIVLLILALVVIAFLAITAVMMVLIPDKWDLTIKEWDSDE